MTEAQTRTPAAIAAAASSLGRDMLDTLMGHVEKIPGWSMSGQQTRDAAVKALREAVEGTIRSAIQIIGSGQFPACGGVLANVSFGAKGIRASVEIDRKAPGRHELIEMAGLEVVLLMANHDDYLSRMQDVKDRSSQADLFPATDPDYKGVPETAGEIRESIALAPTTALDEICINCSHTFASHTDPTCVWGVGDATHCYNHGCSCGEFIHPATHQSSENPDAPDVTSGNNPDDAPADPPSDGALMKIADLRVVLAGQLAQIDITVTAAQVDAMTDAQARAAYEYAVRLADYPQSSLPRPFYLPEPTPGSPE